MIVFILEFNLLVNLSIYWSIGSSFVLYSVLFYVILSVYVSIVKLIAYFHFFLLRMELSVNTLKIFPIKIVWANILFYVTVKTLIFSYDYWFNKFILFILNLSYNPNIYKNI